MSTSSRSIDVVINDLFRPYEARLTGQAGDTRELIAITDLCYRIAYTVVVSSSRATLSPVQAVAAPGIGTMLAVVRGAAKAESVKDGDVLRARTRTLALKLVDASDRFRVPGHYSDFRYLRNQLAHGHALPIDEPVAEATQNALSILANEMKIALRSYFGGGELLIGTKRLRLKIDSVLPELELWPLWVSLNNSPEVGIYSHADSGALYYLVPGRAVFTITNGEAVGQFRRDFLAAQHEDKVFGRFVSDLVRDISSFTEDYSQPSYYLGDDEADGTLVVPWTRSTSDNNVERVDMFRIGLDNQRQWFDAQSQPQQWKRYSVFLREVTNWGVLSRRIRIGLEYFTSERVAEESDQLGFSGNYGARLPQRLTNVAEDLESPTSAGPIGKAFELQEAVDAAVEVHKQATKVFFIVGNAGLGKTRMMVDTAMARAQEVEMNPELDVPLYLFVSSTGRALASLEDAVNSALNITKLLSAQGARTLCRNGMLVLFVDGFDELLGGSGYENALGSLEPWFRDLGGRGVLVASARSSYYLTQYRRSLSETSGVAVDHVLAELQPWSVDECSTFFSNQSLPAVVVNGITAREWDLLRLPFFAKAFVAWHRGGRPTAHNLSIFDIVVGHFLQRESLKLNDPNLGQVMTEAELRLCFSLLGEQMQRTGSREVEFADLCLAAQAATDTNSLDQRPGLAKRLNSLCGLGVASQVGAVNRFRFSHEILFDCFLALAIEASLSDEKLIMFRLLLEKGKIHAAALDWLAERESRRVQAAVLRIMEPQRWTAFPSILAENLGALWMSLLRVGYNVPPFAFVRGVRLGAFALAGSGWSEMLFEHCAMERFELPLKDSQHLGFVGCEIDLLVCGARGTVGRIVHRFESSEIHALIVGGEYYDLPSDVRRELAALGLIELATTDTSSEATEAAKFFLGHLTRRSEVSVVARVSSHLTDDHRLRWTNRLGHEMWLRFVDALEGAGLAHWEPINAGGPAKSRLIFEVAPAVIRRRGGDSRVAAFWTELARV